jgi:hypothetical protein
MRKHRAIAFPPFIIIFLMDIISSLIIGLLFINPKYATADYTKQLEHRIVELEEQVDELKEQNEGEI